MRILHVAAHMGGGIGSAYAGLGTCGEEQRILLLEPPIDKRALEKTEDAGFHIIAGGDSAAVRRELTQADLVLFSWHHHPALTRFLHDFPQIPIRSALWCHVSGNYFPHVPGAFLKLFDQVLFATPYTLALSQVQGLGKAYCQEHFQVVYGLNDLARFADLKRHPSGQFTVGYVGTLGFCKLHPAFVEFCKAVDVPDVRFQMVGAPSAKTQISEEAGRWGIASRIQFSGQLPDVAPALAGMDVFSYLLNPQHFGATENALLEAMAAGLPVIALDQCVERHIVRDGVTGLLVHSPEEYGNAVRHLWENPDKAAYLGRNARADILKRYSIEENRRRFLAACRKAVNRDKRIHSFAQFYSGEPADWFLSCVKADRDCFEKSRPQDAGLIFRENTKGSSLHYHTYFPADRRLAQWAGKIKHSHLDREGRLP